MRKRHQKMLLELLGTLGRTNGKIAKLPPSNAAAITNLLADCQDCAEQIFDFVEQLEGEGTKTASYIKEYYELLYQASTELKGFEKLQKQIEKIEASVRSDLKPNKIEIAFFPYKASMWDSLESIWLAAKDDPACDAYVVPIPYYEKQPNGAFGRMRYEGGEYPSYVPVVDWQKYNAEERRPDAIFIHNPYDGGNYVTSVHPDFYSEKLRGFTDMLCYVPYFVCGGDEVGEHFATTLGCVYAHKVIVQSEKIRDSYIRAFKKQYGGRLGGPEDKFVALGSPKFDKAVNSKREDFALPEDWRRIMDGKKVVLYNTTIGALLEGNEKYLQKIRSVLDAFRNRSDVALLWRPHPLNEATYRTMRPQLLNEYGRIVEEYRREGWGIYDDTADLHRAIAWSDGYYGDWSSVVAMYEAAGKPVVIQNVETPYAFSELGFKAPLTLSVHDNKLYYHLHSRNAVFEFDLETFVPRYFNHISGKAIFNRAISYFHSRVDDGKLFFIPCNSNDIAIYDFSERRYKVHELDLSEECKPKEKGRNGLFQQYIHRKNKIFLFPDAYSAIAAYNIQTGETEHCLDLREEFFGTQLSFRQYEFLDSKTVLLPSIHSNEVLEFNLDDYSYAVHKIGRADVNLCSIAKHNGNFWLTAINKPIVYKWDCNTGNVAEFVKFPKDFCNTSKKFPYLYGANIIKYLNHLYMFPSRANMVCRVNMDSGEIERLAEFDKYCIRGEEGDKPFFNRSVLHNGKIYLWQKDKILLEYDIETKAIRECKNLFEFSDDDYRRLSSDYLDSLAKGTEIYKADNFEILNCGAAGQAIYEHCRQRGLGL